MENICEFCRTLSPVVYCQADAAHLCLSCDAKVHSANALSYRHPRTLVCESCKSEPAYVRCQDHRMFLCQSCDAIHHVSFQHQRKVVNSYSGSPSAKDLAALWGFDLENKCVNKNQSVSHRSCLAKSNTSEMDNLSSAVCTEMEEGSSTRGTEVVKNDIREKDTGLILQQILDLEKLQISESIGSSCSIHVKERMNSLSLENDVTWKMQKDLNCQMNHFDQNLDFQHMGSPQDETIEEPFSSTFSHLENLTSNGNSLHGDSFWQCKSPAPSNEIWLHSMQDLGVCDEGQCFDDVNIPDVDLTFRNFEELFGSEHEQTRSVIDDMDIAYSFAPKYSPFAKIEQRNDEDKKIHPSDQVHQRINSYSASSFSVSRITGESSGSEYKDDGLSPTSINQKSPHGPCNVVDTRLDGKENVIRGYKEKKVLRHEKQGQYTSDVKKQRKEQFSLVEGASHWS